MTQTAIPFLFMRGGTSRGPYFNRADLPADKPTLAKVLVALLGSGHSLNIDGIGGGNAVTTKVAMLSKSKDQWAEIDYFFAQVSVEDRLVDFKPTCGNILSGVAAAAIEMGLHPITGAETDVRIKAVNTGAEVLAKVKTPNGAVSYAGDTKMAGVPGTAAAVKLNFMKVAGSSTGAFLPTGNLIDIFDGIAVTCMDVAMPMVIAKAESFGLAGNETCAELTANQDFFNQLEAVRLQAGLAMGLGDVTRSVIPKFGLLAPAQNGGTIATRYFMPWSVHPSMAVTGGQCLAACALTPGTVADGLLKRPHKGPATVILEHPMGLMEVLVDFELVQGKFQHKSSGLVRTCRMLAAGQVFVPQSIWVNR